MSEETCDYKEIHPQTEIGEHHFHKDICCKCGYDRINKTKLNEEELLKLRQEVW